MSAKASHIFSTKNIGIFQIYLTCNFNETLTNDVVNFEQPGPGHILCYHGKSQSYSQRPTLSGTLKSSAKKFDKES